MDNQEEIQHGCPGVLGFIFYIGQPMNPHGELDREIQHGSPFYILLWTTKKKSNMGVQVYLDLFFITVNQ